MKRMLSILAVILCVAGLLSACTGSQNELTCPIPAPRHGEAPVIRLELEGPAAARDAEISGLAWHDETLILLPQYPDWDNFEGYSRLFGLAKGDVINAVVSPGRGPLTPFPIQLITPDIRALVPGFQGFEAIACRDDSAWLSIEANEHGVMKGYLIKGDFSPDGKTLTLEPETLILIGQQDALPNMSWETIVVDGFRTGAAFEANGKNVNSTPHMRLFDLNCNDNGFMPFPTMEYRITDATLPDADGGFWVINDFWPGEKDLLLPADDALALCSSPNATHAFLPQVERLVFLRFTQDGITAPTRSINLQLETRPRNWEGIAKLDDMGFLLATDKSPETILAFVPAPR